MGDSLWPETLVVRMGHAASFSCKGEGGNPSRTRSHHGDLKFTTASKLDSYFQACPSGAVTQKNDIGTACNNAISQDQAQTPFITPKGSTRKKLTL